MRVKYKLAPFLRNVAVSSISDAIIVASNVVLVRVLALGLGPGGFGLYSVMRRAVATIFPLSGISLHISIPRYVALGRGRNRQHERYGIAGIVVGLAGTLVFVGATALILIGSQGARSAVFDYLRDDMAPLAMGLLLVGYTSFMLVIAWHRGLEQIKAYNWWRVGVTGVVPALVAWWLADDVGASGIILVFSGIYLASFPSLIRNITKGLHVLAETSWNITEEMRELIGYGCPRMPAGLAKHGLLSIGPLLAPVIGTVAEAGYFFVAIGIIRALEAAVEGFGVVALPAVARLLGTGRKKFVGHRLRDLITFLVHTTPFLLVHLWIWTDVIVHLWVGNEFRTAVPLIQLVLLGVPGYIAFGLLRAPIDAVDTRPINTVSSVVALGVGCMATVGFFLGGAQTSSLGIGTAIGMTSLGVLSVGYLIHRYGYEYRDALIGSTLSYIVLSAACSFWIHGSATKEGITLWSGGIGFATVGILGCIYIWILVKRRVQWTQEILKRIRRSD